MTISDFLLKAKHPRKKFGDQGVEVRVRAHLKVKMWTWSQEKSDVGHLRRQKHRGEGEADAFLGQEEKQENSSPGK